MRLISLELHGFKSFPDKTVLKFAPGVTTVVGPNGSGKSNISDAVRWVLGEISSKNMRGTKMEDVIFGGTDKRKPMSFAEVSLTLDNREEEGFSRLQSEYDEVTVTRRYNRNGTSDYMINRVPVRLKDINALFMNTGIGRDGYSIVSQGKAAEIISQKSDERRNVFEEAAGISRYRYQKNDAEKKLAETVQNCERLADILLEKKNILDKLEKDAERARRYLEVYEKKKEADVSLSVYEVNGIRARLGEKSGKFESLRNALSIADKEIEDASAELDRLDIEKNRANERSSSLTEEIERITLNQHSEDTTAQTSQVELNMKNEQIDEYNETVRKLNVELAAFTENADNASKKLAEVAEKKLSAEQKRDRISSDNARLSEEIDALDLEIEGALSEAAKLNERQDALRLRLAELDATSASASSRKEELENEIAEREKSTEACKDGMVQYKRRMDDYQQKADKIKEKNAETLARLEALRAERDTLNEKIAGFASDIRDIRTRIDSLRRMEELFEGYPHSVSALMNASKHGKLSGIIGPLSHIFTVKSEYSLAIETALGANIQNIVCETDEAAKSAVAWLKQNNAGRSTFYPLNTMQVTPLAVDVGELKKHRGYIGIASELLEYEPKFDRVIKNLLGRTLVFDNLDNANATSKAFGYRIRIVTRDGQLVNAGGSITGGAAKRESGVLNRSATIDRLNADRLKVEADKKTAEERYNEVSGELNELTRLSQEDENKLKLLNSLYQADNTHYTAFEAQLNTVNETVNQLREQLNDTDNNKKSIANEKASIQSEVLKIKEELGELEKRRAENDGIKQKDRQRLNEGNKLYQDAMIDVTALSKDVEAAQRDLEGKLMQKQSCADEIARTEGRIAENKSRIAEIRETILRSASLAKKLQETVKEKASERDAAEALSRELDQKLTSLRNEHSEKLNARSVLSTDFSKLEAQLESLNSDLDRTVAYLQSEYEITFSEAEALNYPPVTAENRDEVSKLLTELKYKLRGIGSVDPSSIEEYKVAKETYEEMNKQFEDLTRSREQFASTVELLEKEMRTRFVEVMGEINVAFQNVFRELFGGGSAELVLTDPDDVLHCGIDINVAPPGKIIKSLSLLSGGEQAFISIALFFAILHVNPSPFCIFDEIEAALDEVNVAMFANYIKKYSDKTQFITITHRRGTMEVADTLYGVTMAERGISRVLTLNVNEVESKLGVKL